MSEKFNQLEYIKEFNKRTYKHYHLQINRVEKEVIEHLDKQPSKNGYIIKLIKNDMKKG